MFRTHASNVIQPVQSNDDPGETDGPLHGPVIRYDLTTAQLALNPPIRLVYQAIGVTVSCMLVRLAWELRSVWSAWALAALVVVGAGAICFEFVVRTRKGRTVRFRRAGAHGQDAIVWEFDSASAGELSGPLPLLFLRRERGVLGTVVLRSISGHSGILPTSVYEELVAHGMPDVPKQWGRK